MEPNVSHFDHISTLWCGIKNLGRNYFYIFFDRKLAENLKSLRDNDNIPLHRMILQEFFDKNCLKLDFLDTTKITW